MGREELKWRQVTHNQLMSPQGPHFAKTNDKSRNLRKNGIYWCISDVVTASVYSEKTRLKKLMLIMNKSQESKVFGGCQKLTFTMKQRPEK